MSNGAQRDPTTDEQAAIAWWSTLTQTERAEALERTGWKADGSDTPSVADAWMVFKLRSRTAAAGKKPLRYVVLLGRHGQAPHVFDTLTRTRLKSYATVADAEQQAMRLNQR
jgi:hypothetical protein